MRDGERLPGVPEDDDDRIVAHVDADCFYAACERLREPEQSIAVLRFARGSG